MKSARLLNAAVAALLGVTQLRAQSPTSVVTLPAYRARLLGVFSFLTGEPIEAAEVVDALSHTSALTSKTGTVSLAFLPDGGSLVRVQRIGFQPVTIMAAISPADTIPITVLLSPIAKILPTVVTKDSNPHYVSPGLRAFEDRRTSGAGGRFITEADLRKSDNRKLPDVMRSAGVEVRCTTRPTSCYAVSRRNGGCAFLVFQDGMRLPDEWRDLDKMQVSEFGAIEIYSGAATIPPQYNMTGSACGVILMWTRERH